MRRFFISGYAQPGGQATITGRDARHITRILRMGPGDTLDIVDSAGKEYSARIRAGSEDGISLDVICERSGASREPSVFITILQGLPKGDKMDKVVRRNTEIGVSRFVPVITERSIPRLDETARTRRVDRWRRIAEEASKQSGRQRVPDVLDVVEFDAAMQFVSEEKTRCRDRGRKCLILFPWELETTKGVRDILKKGAGFSEVMCFIGPEGGFSHDEAENAVRHGAELCSLGPRILRTETCALVLSSIILYEAGEMG
ncbi:MAG: 16S rRNA (uracil(1498)-N(3))-methyltransferase [Firmicutes bacterium]|jgi:16S rRNA (uracil1498-N3)-methyltransferase|nr:16S rRNA (uracil(1498)-N(3))-methyltransferase [Bacillota bacterium]HXL03714.1 RsmE family RNA methyltransferase [Bacillota bacterium]